MLLEVKNASFSYGERMILHEINMAVNEHDVFAILGRNGAGKTTLLKCIMGILPWKSGGALLNGSNIREIPHKSLWQQIAYVPQARQGSDISVRDMVVLGRSSRLKVFSNPNEKDYAIAEEILRKLEITSLADKKCNQLSGGELQLVLIGRAMAAQPKLLIMDEPESNLDYNNQIRVLRLIRELSRETACILNTHYPEHALRFADHSLLLFDDGTCISGDSGEVITEDNLQKTFCIDVFIGRQSIGHDKVSYIIPMG